MRRSTVVQYFLNELESGEKNTEIAYFYCDKSEEQRKDPEEVMRSLVRQVAVTKKNGRIKHPVLKMFTERKWHTEDLIGLAPAKVSLDDCVELLSSLLEDSESIILIDTLDECRDSSCLLRILKQISDWTSIKIFLTGRDSVSGEIASHDLPSLLPFSAANNQEDIERYVKREVDSMVHNKRLLHGKVSKSLRNDIIKTLEDISNGMYVQQTILIKWYNSLN